MAKLKTERTPTRRSSRIRSLEPSSSQKPKTKTSAWKKLTTTAKKLTSTKGKAPAITKAPIQRTSTWERQSLSKRFAERADANDIPWSPGTEPTPEQNQECLAWMRWNPFGTRTDLNEDEQEFQRARRESVMKEQAEEERVAALQPMRPDQLTDDDERTLQRQARALVWNNTNGKQKLTFHEALEMFKAFTEEVFQGELGISKREVHGGDMMEWVEYMFKQHNIEEFDLYASFLDVAPREKRMIKWAEDYLNQEGQYMVKKERFGADRTASQVDVDNRLRGVFRKFLDECKKKNKAARSNEFVVRRSCLKV